MDKVAVRKLVADSTWMSVKTAMAFGFVDASMESQEMVASVDILNMKKPKQEAVMSEVEKEVEASEVVEAVVADAPKEVIAEEVIDSPKAEENIEAEVASVGTDTLEDFMAAFGDGEGARMFVNGVTFAEGQSQVMASQKTEIEALKAELAEKDEQIKAFGKIGGEPLDMTPVAEVKETQSVIRLAK